MNAGEAPNEIYEVNYFFPSKLWDSFDLKLCGLEVIRRRVMSKFSTILEEYFRIIFKYFRNILLYILEQSRAERCLCSLPL